MAGEKLKDGDYVGSGKWIADKKLPPKRVFEKVDRTGQAKQTVNDGNLSQSIRQGLANRANPNQSTGTQYNDIVRTSNGLQKVGSPYNNVNSVDQANAMLNASTQYDQDTLVPSTTTPNKDSYMNQVKADLEPITGRPKSNYEERQNKMFEDADIDGKMGMVDDIDSDLQELDDAFQETKDWEESREGTMRKLTGRVSQDEKAYYRRRNELLRQKQDLTQELNTSMNLIEMNMEAYGMDFENAKEDYDKAFNRNIQMYNLATQAENRDFDRDQQLKARASANYATMFNAVQSGKLNLDDMSESQRLQISQMEAQAGIPMGTINQIAVDKPQAKMLFNNNYTNEAGQTVTEMFLQNPDGSITTQKYYGDQAKGSYQNAGTSYSDGKKYANYIDPNTGKYRRIAIGIDDRKPTVVRGGSSSGGSSSNAKDIQEGIETTNKALEKSYDNIASGKQTVNQAFDRFLISNPLTGNVSYEQGLSWFKSKINYEESQDSQGTNVDRFEKFKTSHNLDPNLTEEEYNKNDLAKLTAVSYVK